MPEYFLLLNINFYLRQNPFIFTEDIKTDDLRRYNITAANLTIPFRIEDVAGKPVYNYEEFINVKITHIASVYNYTTKNIDYYEYVYKPVTCTEELVPDLKFSKDRNLSEWLCIPFNADSNDNKYISKDDLEELKTGIAKNNKSINKISNFSKGKNKYANENGLYFGGDWSGKFVHIFSIEISNCNVDKVGCSDIKSVENYLNSDKYVYFSTFYPSVYVVPNDKDNLFHLKYINYYYRLNEGMMKTDRNYFKNYYANDDVGWIFKDFVYESTLVQEVLISDFSLLSYKGLKDEFVNFYRYIIYYNSDYIIYTRSFMKLQELAALVGGFMKLIMFICQTITYQYNIYLMKQTLINKFFSLGDDNINNNNNDNNLLNNINNKSSSNNNNNSNIDLKNNSNNNNLRNIRLQNNKEYLNLNNNSINISNLEKIDKDINTSNNNFNIHALNPISKISKFSPNIANNNNNNNNNKLDASIVDYNKNLKKELNNNVIEGNKINTTNKYLFHPGTITSIKNKNYKFKKNYHASMNFFKDFYYNVLCQSKKKNNNNLYYYNYYKAESLLSMKLDIFSYFNMINQFEHLKSILFNKEQNKTFNYLKYPNVNNLSDINRVVNTLHKDLLNKNEYNYSKLNINANKENLKSLLLYYSNNMKANKSVTDNSNNNNNIYSIYDQMFYNNMEKFKE